MMSKRLFKNTKIVEIYLRCIEISFKFFASWLDLNPNDNTP